MKRILAILLTVCFILAAVGCSVETGGGSSSAAVDEETGEINYPGDQAVTVVVPFSAGGEHDLTARAIANEMSKWGYTMVIQNTTGDVATALDYYHNEKNADGYTLLMNSPEVMACAYANGTMSEDIYKDLIYLGNFVFDAGVICVKADAPYDTLEELIAAAQAAPGTLSWASVGSAGKNYLDSIEIMNTIGAEFNYVPYPAANESRAAVLGGHADVFYAYVSGAKATVDSGELKVLAVVGEERSPYFPDAPTCKELGYDISAGLTRCWDAHPDTDPAIIEKLTNDLQECQMAEETQEVLDGMGLAPNWMTNEEMHDFADLWYENYTRLYNELVASTEQEG